MTTPTRRRTRQKNAIWRALDDAQGFMSAQELHEGLQDSGETVALTTVYRNLARMEAEGLVDAVRTPDGELAYRACAHAEHHHHLVCRRCGYSVELEAPAVESWARDVGRRHRFTELSHDLEVFGLCERCG